MNKKRTFVEILVSKVKDGFWIFLWGIGFYWTIHAGYKIWWTKIFN